jgi:hypothetical protein
MPVAIEITDGHTGAVLEHIGKCITGTLKVSLAVVHVEPRPQSILLAPEFVSAAHDEQVRMPITVRIDKARADVLGYAVRGNGRLSAGTEGSIALLDKKLTRLPLRPANVEIVKPVAVHIRHRQPRSLR